MTSKSWYHPERLSLPSPCSAIPSTILAIKEEGEVCGHDYAVYIVDNWRQASTSREFPYCLYIDERLFGMYSLDELQSSLRELKKMLDAGEVVKALPGPSSIIGGKIEIGDFTC